jgi:hypothetical protein
MTPSRGWESQPLRSKKLQALLLLITGVRVWLGCVLESGCGCQPPFPADGTYLPLAKGEQVATNIKVLSNVVDCEDVRADAIVLAALAAADKAARVALAGDAAVRLRSTLDKVDSRADIAQVFQVLDTPVFGAPAPAPAAAAASSSSSARKRSRKEK